MEQGGGWPRSATRRAGRSDVEGTAVRPSWRLHGRTAAVACVAGSGRPAGTYRIERRRGHPVAGPSGTRSAPRPLCPDCALLDLLGQSGLWPLAYLQWEIALLEEMGFALDLATCAVTGATEDLAYVSPRTGARGQPRRRRGLGRPSSAAATRDAGPGRSDRTRHRRCALRHGAFHGQAAFCIAGRPSGTTCPGTPCRRSRAPALTGPSGLQPEGHRHRLIPFQDDIAVKEGRFLHQGQHPEETSALPPGRRRPSRSRQSGRSGTSASWTTGQLTNGCTAPSPRTESPGRT